jgi:hypothetical protein
MKTRHLKTMHASDEDLMLYALGEMPEDKAAKGLPAHVETCDSCRKRLDHEKSLQRILKRQPLPVPNETVLALHRTRLMQRLRVSMQQESKRTAWAGIKSLVGAARPYSLQWATVAVVFCAGLLAGRVSGIFQNNPGAASAREAMLALESSVPLSGFDVRSAETEKDRVEIRFTSAREYVVSGNVSSRNIQRALSYLLKHSPGDHTRLRALNLLARSRPDRDEVREALIHTLENDGNPGVRLKSIRLLIAAFPVNETVKKVLIRALIQDPNEGIRIAAANSLNRLADPDMLPLLKQQSSATPYVQSLTMKNQ